MIKDSPHVTEFQKKVYAAAQTIPRGRVTTYKMLADYIGCTSSQAVGQALRRNPFAPEVPCHRVIKSDLTIGGFFGKIEGDPIKRKLAMLKNEGVEFSGIHLLEKEKIIKLQKQL